MVAKTRTRIAKNSNANGPQRFVCVHGHFYQPPRENPWLETVEVQDSAAPYHDWNDRITAECYAPNGASRITSKENEIIRIMNNYARMSFNFGPTLLSWIEDFAPRTYRMITDADQTSTSRYGGHGSAMAQVYNHIIMPLANTRDAITQIRWGIADFEHRFGRRPEGMWLAETAVNRNVLNLMSQQGILFTVLAPNQCARVRQMAQAAGTSSNPELDPVAAAADAAATPDEEPWLETPDASVDPTRPYLVQLDEGRSIAVFFYDGPNSRAIAFEGLLNSGETFAKRLLGGFPDTGGDEFAQLVHVATDGESYGHHHKHGEMALSYAMHCIEDSGYARLTNYGEFLEKFPPRWEAEVAEDTSWSCAHGVERWRSDCGCNGGRQGWNQQWRAPLREALDFLRDQTAPLAERVSRGLFHDLWQARDAYVQVILDRVGNTESFFEDQATHKLSQPERVRALELMELERHTQLMYTSCGWFFDELSGIETVQIIAYAARVLQLAAKLFGKEGVALETEFLELLARAKSNIPEMGDGAQIYRRFVTAMKIGLEQVGAHYAISSIFRSYPEQGEIFCFDVHRQGQQAFNSGRGRVSLGRALIHSRVTEESEEICYAVLHLGDQNLSAAVRSYDASDRIQVAEFEAFSSDVAIAIRRANLPEVIRLIDRFFGGTAYSLMSLFADEQHRILNTILTQTITEMEEALEKIYEDHASLLHFLSESGMAAPPALASAARFAINASLRSALESETIDTAEIDVLLKRAVTDQVPLDTAILGYAAGQCMKRAMVQLEMLATSDDPRASAALSNALVVADTIGRMPFEVNLWQAQNIWNDFLRRSDREKWRPEWTEDFRRLGQTMHINVERLVTEAGVTAFSLAEAPSA